MKAIEISQPGGPEVLRISELPMPEPAAGQVLVKVHAAGVNRPDILQRQGGYPPPPGAPLTPGLEIAGEVMSAGDALQGWRQGLRAGAGRRLCGICRGGGGQCAAGAARVFDDRSGGHSGNLFYGVDQCVRPGPPAAGRDHFDTWRLERNWHNGDPAGQGFRVEGCRHRGQRREMRGMPGLGRRCGDQLQNPGLCRRAEGDAPLRPM